MSHAHILIFLHPSFRHSHPNDIDKIISAEIPDERTDHDLFKVVSSLMIHGPCEVQNKKSPCIQNGRCLRYFSKKFVEQTIDADGYPLYRQIDNGKVITKGHF